MVDTQKAAAVLARSEYVLFTTFRRDGRPVQTPVWMAPAGDRLVFTTGSATGKAKRLRHTSRVLLAPCGPRGGRRGKDIAATARLVALDDTVLDAVRGKYGWKFRVVHALERLAARRRGAAEESVGVEVRLSPLPAEG